jgi:hypothetical protein
MGKTTVNPQTVTVNLEDEQRAIRVKYELRGSGVYFDIPAGLTLTDQMAVKSQVREAAKRILGG